MHLGLRVIHTLGMSRMLWMCTSRGGGGGGYLMLGVQACTMSFLYITGLCLMQSSDANVFSLYTPYPYLSS